MGSPQKRKTRVTEVIALDLKLRTSEQSKKDIGETNEEWSETFLNRTSRILNFNFCHGLL